MNKNRKKIFRKNNKKNRTIMNKINKKMIKITKFKIKNNSNPQFLKNSQKIFYKLQIKDQKQVKGVEEGSKEFLSYSNNKIKSNKMIIKNKLKKIMKINNKIIMMNKNNRIIKKYKIIKLN